MLERERIKENTERHMKTGRFADYGENVLNNNDGIASLREIKTVEQWREDILGERKERQYDTDCETRQTIEWEAERK